MDKFKLFDFTKLCDLNFEELDLLENWGSNESLRS